MNVFCSIWTVFGPKLKIFDLLDGKKKSRGDFMIPSQALKKLGNLIIFLRYVYVFLFNTATICCYIGYLDRKFCSQNLPLQFIIHMRIFRLCSDYGCRLLYVRFGGSLGACLKFSKFRLGQTITVFGLAQKH